MPEERPPGAVAITRVDDEGIELQGTADDVLDVLFDGRRIWSFRAVRDSEPSESPGSRLVEWPGALSGYLDGVVRLTVRGHGGERDLFDQEISLGSSDQRIEVVNTKGVPLSLDKSGRLQMTFDTRTSDQVAPLLDSVERVLHALHRAGVEAFPAYGTLLGAVRDGALIGHDSDADLGYVSRHTHPVDVILESFAIERQLMEMGFRVVRYSGGGIKVLVPEGDGHLRGLDVFSGFLDEEGNLVLMGEVRVPFDRSWIYPLGTTTLEGRELPAPADPGKLLAATYGPGWSTPDPAFQFETPASTSRRLNDWFRGFMVNRSDWDRHYQRRRYDPVPRIPSGLAKFAHPREPDAELFIDVGCGRGTDARWLARQGVPTIGLDFSPRGFEMVAEDPEADELPLEFEEMNLLELRHVFSRGALLGLRKERRAVLARHVLDAMPPRGRQNLWRFVRLALHGGGRAYLEFLVSPVGDDDRWAQRNLVSPLRPEAVSASVRSHGGEVDSVEIVGSQEMGLPHKKKDMAYERRRACRMVTRWPE